MGRRDTLLVLLLVAVILVLAAVTGATSERDGSGDPRASTFVRGSEGSAALFWTLQELRLPVARSTRALLTADSVRGAVALVAPTSHPTPEVMGLLARHVREGGTLVFVAGTYEAGGAAYDTLGLAPHWLRGLSPVDDDGREARALPHPWTAGVQRVAGFRRAFSDSSRAVLDGGAQTLLEVDGHPAALTWRMGKGRVIAFSDARPLSNGRLRRSGAAAVFARAAAEAARGDTLHFDEWHHGFRSGPRVNMVGAIARHAGRVIPAGVWLQLLLALALLLWVAGRRFGAPLLPAPARRRSPLEHVEALAGAYRQAGARRTARRLLMAGLARRLGRRAPADEAAAGEMLERMARQSPVGRAAAAELEKDWKRGADADLVPLARAVDRYLDEVRRP